MRYRRRESLRTFLSGETQLIELARRRSETKGRFEELRYDLASVASLVTDKACAYATGSFGRGEACKHSDLDVFIVGKDKEGSAADVEQGRSSLSRLDEICLKARLINLTRDHNIQEFSGDGRYLTSYSLSDLIGTLGKPEDDATNTFTARLLLLLESKPLLGDEVHEGIVNRVIEAYWRDYPDHYSDFVRAFLTNDVLRLWRTFCVNYEAGTERQPDDKKAKGKVKNFKLKHSRLLTCYSALLWLMNRFNATNSVSPADALEMIQFTPTERIEDIAASLTVVSDKLLLQTLLDKYADFLTETNAKESELIERFMDKNYSRAKMRNADDFGGLIFDAVARLGNNSRLHRIVVV